MPFGKARFLLPGLALFLLTGACGGGGKAYDPRLPGPFAAGEAQFTFTDETRDRTLPTSVWYPADPAGEPDRSGAPYPLVIFSHGSGGSRDNYTFLTIHLATHGFVVAAPDHQGNVGIDTFIPREPYMMIKRPADISFVLDQMVALAEGDDPVLSGLFDPERIGASGHSFGGYTTLVLSGAEIQAEEFNAMCAAPDANPRCGFLTLPDEIPAMADARIKAGVSLAPGLNDLFGATAAGVVNVGVPTLILGGTTDVLVPAAALATVHAALPPNPKILVMLLGGGHSGFTDAGNIDGFLESERVWEITRTFATAFFQVHLAGDTRYEEYLGREFAGEFSAVPADLTFLREPE